MNARRMTLAFVLLAAVISPSLAQEPAPPAFGPVEQRALQPGAAEPAPPAGDDFTAASVRAYQDRLLAHYGGDYKNMPLAAKARFFQWMWSRYHFTIDDHISHHMKLPAQRGLPPEPMYGRDTSTWNGAAMTALCYQYAVTRDPQTLAMIVRLVKGLHLYQQVTGGKGLAGRCVMRSDKPVAHCNRRYVAPDGTIYHFETEPAKGTYNQLVGGYAALMMYAGGDLPPEVFKMAQDDMAALVYHVIYHDYKLTEVNGEPTPFGDLTPRISTIGVPFNAQVAYMIVATGAYYPPESDRLRKIFLDELHNLRDKHHVYYEDPSRHLIRPQEVGGSRFVKGMNDRFHVTTAAFTGLNLELTAARASGRPFDRTFVYQLGQTLYWTMSEVHDKKNSLLSFMWGGLLSDPQVFGVVIPKHQEATRKQVAVCLDQGVEQLRHFPLDRFFPSGKQVETKKAVWVDEFRPDDYRWKHNPLLALTVAGPPTDELICPVDFLQAYWLMRMYKLDEHPAVVEKHRAVLERAE